jgi:predicted dehydrogenase
MDQAMEQIKVGIVGLGWVAGAHIEAFKAVDGASVTAVCDIRQLDEADLEKTYGIPLRPYQEFEEMLADKSIHVIDVCTPHPLHPRLAIAAAQAGKHLIIEKPISLDWKDALSVRDAINEAGILACVCFECRYSKHFSLIRSVIDKDLLGELHYAEVDYYHGIGPWYGQYEWNVRKDMGGSSLLTAGCHALDALLFFMDSEVEEVTSYSTHSSGEEFEPYQYDTTSVTILRFSDGSVGKVASVIDCLQPYYFHVHLVGSSGSLLDNRFYSSKLEGLSKERWTTLETAPIDSGDVSDHPYQPQFQSFVDSIQNGEPMPLTDFETALETHRILFAADFSAAEGRPIRLSDFA